MAETGREDGAKTRCVGVFAEPDRHPPSKSCASLVGGSGQHSLVFSRLFSVSRAAGGKRRGRVRRRVPSDGARPALF